MMSKAITSKILLCIDDEHIIRQLIVIALDNFSNWQTKIAASGQEGLTAIAQAKPDAILLDMMMPHMDGLTFLKHLQADAEVARIPIILLTSCTDVLKHHTVTELGIKGTIAKPFDPITLVSQIANILGW